MKSHLISSVAVVAGIVSSVSAHATVTFADINGEKQPYGEKVYIRTPKNPDAQTPYYNGPVKDLTSDDMNCNNNNVEVPEWLAVLPGDTVTLHWEHEVGSSPGDVFASSHVGPVLSFISPAADLSFVKLTEAGYDGSWATDQLIAAGGAQDVTIPEGLAPGDYLLRAQFIGLQADALYDPSQPPAGQRGAQFYPSCTQIRVGGSGTITLPEGVNFASYYKGTKEEGVLFNPYNAAESPPSEYPIPGPALWDGASAGAPATPAPAEEETDPSTGEIPAQDTPSTPDEPVEQPIVPDTPVTPEEPVESPDVETPAGQETDSEIADVSATQSEGSAATSSGASMISSSSSSANVPQATESTPVVPANPPVTNVPANPPAGQPSAPDTPPSPAPATGGTGSYVDYSGCMSAMNECMNKINAVPGGGAKDFSSCQVINGQCNSLRKRMMHVRRAP